MKKLFSFLLFPMILCAQQKRAASDLYMTVEAALYHFSGNVLLAKQGKVIYQRSFGYADAQTKQLLDSNSVFDIGSIAKEFTAVGILQLKDKGLLSLSDSLRKFFPELPYQNITVRQLLTHTSGVPSGFKVVTANFDHSKVASNMDMVRLLASAGPPLLFAPGTDLMYSGTGFNLLAAIIEKLSGTSYKEYMQQHIFGPLGMAHTQVANGPRSRESIAGLAYGYTLADGKMQWADTSADAWPTYLAGITGEGMQISTVGDMLKWDRALHDNTLLLPATQAEQLTMQAQRTTVPVVQFGYGMRVGKNERGNFIFHNGLYPGYQAMHIRYVDDDITAIVLSNNESHVEFIADALVNIEMGKQIVMPYRHNMMAGMEPLPRNLVGKYLMPLGLPPYAVRFPVELKIIDNRLYFSDGREKDILLEAESATKFFFKDGSDQQIELEVNGDGMVTKVWKVSWGLREEVRRMDN